MDGLKTYKLVLPSGVAIVIRAASFQMNGQRRDFFNEEGKVFAWFDLDKIVGLIVVEDQCKDEPSPARKPVTPKTN